jgi:flagellar M-ring protein FliF
MPKNSITQVKNIFSRMTTSQMVSFVMLMIITIGGLFFFISWAGQPDYQPLFSGMSPEDAGSVIDHLREDRIQYKIAENGNTILVPKEKVYELRMSLASKGLPQGGTIGFEIFDDTKIGTSEFSQNINYQRALQGELSRTIDRLDEIESSRVHIVMATKSIFQESEKPATASVIVKLLSGKTLAANKVQSIVHLMSSSISGLDPKNVTVVDTKGNMLTRLINEENSDSLSDNQMDLQDKVEKNLENRIKSMLETALGQAKTSIKVSCVLNLKKQEKTEELYYPDNQVIRSEQNFNEITNDGKDKNISGIPGPVSKTEPEKSKDDLKQTSYQKNDKTVNYEIGKVVSHIIEPVGEIKRQSIAVIIDGTYKKSEDDEGKLLMEYIPRSKDEMDKLTNIIKRSVNFDKQRGDEVDVINLPFESTKTEQNSANETNESFWHKIRGSIIYIKYLIVVMVILFAFIFIIRPIVSWITSTIPTEANLSRLPHNVGKTDDAMHKEPKQISFQNEAINILKSDHNSIDLLKQWMSEAS